MTNSVTPEKTSVFQFMEVRAPEPLETTSRTRDYICDDRVTLEGLANADIFSSNSKSAIGRLVYQKVFFPSADVASTTTADTRTATEIARAAPPTPRMLNLSLLEAVMGLLPPRYTEAPGAISPPGAAQPLELEALRGRTYFEANNFYYILPDRLSDVSGPLLPKLPKLLERLKIASVKPNLTGLREDLRTLFGATSVYQVVFSAGAYHADFAESKRALFDTLYLLYVLRRTFSVTLENIIAGLSALHVLEALAVDEYIDQLRTDGGVGPNDGGLFATIKQLYPVLEGWNYSASLEGFPLIATPTDLSKYLLATPVIHPLFARLHYFNAPFNAIQPLGIGDLKVVKQWLCGYVVGEIAHIDNVLLNELKVRSHRRLEKSENTFSYSQSTQSETQRDTQTTDRFELKRETESVINTTFNANANTSLNYKGVAIVANIASGVSYTRTGNAVSKSANTFSREVLDKAVQRVQSNTATQRSSTTLFETEETNNHTFNNVGGSGHISGIFRWLDKKYRAQLYNYGKRMMFEFVVPEPAAFLVESRLQGFSTNLNIPQPPTDLGKQLQSVKLPTFLTGPDSINESEFNVLRTQYDLTEFTYPTQTKRVIFTEQGSGSTYVMEKDLPDDGGIWYAKTYWMQLNSKGYAISKLWLNGTLVFYAQNGNADGKHSNRINYFDININGFPLERQDLSAYGLWVLKPDSSEGSYDLTAAPILLGDDPVALVFGFQDIKHYFLTVTAELTLSSSALLDWQTAVYNKIYAIEKKKVDAINNELTLAYNSQMSAYRSRLDELKATTINNLLQGQSEDFNRQIIVSELKRQCLSLIAKEFDADVTDDQLTDLEAMGSRDVKLESRHFEVTEDTSATTANFNTKTEDVKFPSLILDKAKLKGRYIQFLEQAFEWQHLAYVFYPYFWATPHKWIELMSHADDTDPNLTAFLQAGSAKILLAVTPAYEHAVLHFLATGEPWEGGPSPVIGDPLYIPLYEELRNQQDDLENALPEGESWSFTLPTSLVYLENSSTPLPPLLDDQQPIP